MKLMCTYCLGEVGDALDLEPEATEILCPNCGAKLICGQIFNPLFDINDTLEHCSDVFQSHDYDINHVSTAGMVLTYIPYYSFTAIGKRICHLNTGDKTNEIISFKLEGYSKDLDASLGLIDRDKPTVEELQYSRSHPEVCFNSLYAKLCHSVKPGTAGMDNIHHVAKAIQEERPTLFSVVYLPGDKASMYVSFEVYQKKLEKVYGEVSDNKENIKELEYIEDSAGYEVIHLPILTMCAALKGAYRKVHYSLYTGEYIDENAEIPTVRQKLKDWTV